VGAAFPPRLDLSYRTENEVLIYALEKAIYNSRPGVGCNDRSGLCDPVKP
jgi:hypothetical protein